MKKWLVAGVGLMALSGCGSQSAVGANSADSITTTAVGNIVGSIPSPTPTPTPTADDGASNLGDAPSSDDAATASTNASVVLANDVH